jgi:hypothetical protein
MHILIHLVYSHIVGHSIYLLQAVESVKMWVLLVEQLVLVVTTHWKLIQLVGVHSTQLMSPWLLVLDSIYVLLHKHLVIGVDYVSVIDYSAILVFLLSRKSILLRSRNGSFRLGLLQLKFDLLSFKIVLRVFLVVFRVF